MKYLKSVCARQDSLARIRVRQHHLAGHIHSFSSWSFLFYFTHPEEAPGTWKRNVGHRSEQRAGDRGVYYHCAHGTTAPNLEEYFTKKSRVTPRDRLCCTVDAVVSVWGVTWLRRHGWWWRWRGDTTKGALQLRQEDDTQRVWSYN